MLRRLARAKTKKLLVLERAVLRVVKVLVCMCVFFIIYANVFSVCSFSHSLLNPKQARRAASVCILVAGCVALSLSLSLSLLF